MHSMFVSRSVFYGAIRRDWEHQRRKAMGEDFYRGLLKRYEIAIEWPEAAAKEE